MRLCKGYTDKERRKMKTCDSHVNEEVKFVTIIEEVMETETGMGTGMGMGMTKIWVILKVSTYFLSFIKLNYTFSRLSNR